MGWSTNLIFFFGFNPCFTGTSSHTHISFSALLVYRYVSILVLLEPPLIRVAPEKSELSDRVSILVLLEPPLIRPRISNHNHLQKGFQSLFYWNLLSYTLHYAACVYVNEFQSLFYWNLLSYQNGEHLGRQKEISFNPCFTGTSSHTLSQPGRFRNNSQFQSLFYWNLLSYLQSKLLLLHQEYVSILVLLEPPLIP